MSDRRAPPPPQDNSLLSNSNFLIVVWVFSFVLFLCTPFFVNRRRRLLWWRRFRYCRWDVYVEPDRDPEWYRLALERYDAYRARAAELEEAARRNQLSKEEEEEIRKLFLMERMSGYTMEINPDSILTREEGGNEQDLVASKVVASKDLENQVSTDVSEDTEESDEEPDEESGEMPDKPDEVPDKDAPIEEPNASTHEEGSQTEKEHAQTKDGEEADTDDVDAIDITLMHESNNFIMLPPPGTSLAKQALPLREVPSGCAICLSEFEEGDRVTWAANEDCPHAFHEDCVLQWMLSVGHKTSRRRQRFDIDSDANRDPVASATNFPMLCPCCRQQFISQRPTTSTTAPSQAMTEAPSSELVEQMSDVNGNAANDGSGGSNIDTNNDTNNISNESTIPQGEDNV